MNRIVLIIAIISLIISQQGHSQNKPVTLKPYPSTNKIDQIHDYNGTAISDPYQWLENTQSSETENWINKQNEVTTDYLNQIQNRKDIKNTLAKIWNSQKVGLPERFGNKYFYILNDVAQNQNVLMMSEDVGLHGNTLIDPNKNNPKADKHITDFKISRDGKYLAYSITENESDWNRIYVFDLKKMKVLEDVLDGVIFSNISWKGNGFYYTRCVDFNSEGENFQKYKMQSIYYHLVGTSQEKDEQIMEPVPYVGYSSYVDDNEDYLVITSYNTFAGNEVYIKFLKEEIPLLHMITDDKYHWEIIGIINDSLLVRTNYHAPNYHLLLLNPKQMLPDSTNIRVLLPEKSDIVLQNAVLAAKNIIVSHNKFGTSYVSILDYSGNVVDKVPVPEYGYVDKLKGWKDYNDLYYSFSTLYKPAISFIYDIKFKKNSPINQPVSIFDPDRYTLERVDYLSFDQTKIPLIMVYRKGMEKNGNNPVLLICNEDFNKPVNPYYTPERILFIDNGGILAFPCVRGGNAYGEKWHHAGIKDKLQTGLNDYFSAIQYLIDKSYTRTDKIAIEGNIHGGFYAGAAVFQRPDLFKIVVSRNGIFDLLRYQYYDFDWRWRSEYGSVENKNDVENMLKYSPLQHVKDGVTYPAVLLSTSNLGENTADAHSYKYISTLQEKSQGMAPKLIRIETLDKKQNISYSERKINESADVLSFLFYQLGMNFNSNLIIPEAPVKDKNKQNKPAYYNDPVYKKNLPRKNVAEPEKPGSTNPQPPKK